MAPIAAALHRLNDIHPLPNGNGRIRRAMKLQPGIGTHGSRLASRGWRGLERHCEYKRMMDHADTLRQGEPDAEV
jgi:hypothetical protein